MRYKVGSALVTGLARSTQLLAGTGVLLSYRIRVKVKLRPTILSVAPGLLDPLSKSDFYLSPGESPPAFSILLSDLPNGSLPPEPPERSLSPRSP
jgi:hypothetical protein